MAVGLLLHTPYSIIHRHQVTPDSNRKDIEHSAADSGKANTISQAPGSSDSRSLRITPGVVLSDAEYALKEGPTGISISHRFAV